MTTPQRSQRQQAQRLQPFVHTHRRVGVVLGLLSLSGVVGLSGCKDLTGNQPLPAGTNNPAFYHTAAGARALRNGALYALAKALPAYLTNTGLLTDELESSQTGTSAGVLSQSSLGAGGSIDERILPEIPVGNILSAGPTDGDYGQLQAVRGSIGQALGALAAYDTSAETPRLRGELYALEGYTEILLADFFCSGVPLSTMDFQGDFTYHAGATTAQVYQDAIAAADSALALAGTNDTIQNLARVVKGRALLDLGDYAAAATAVAAVPDAFRYRLAIQWAPFGGTNILNQSATVSDREGGNGLPFLSGGDPRTATIVAATPNPGQGIYATLTFPAKYSTTGYSQFSIADGVEARLIQAEAALKAGDVSTWLTTLNRLRTNGSVTTPADTIADTLGVTDCGSNGYGLCGTSDQQFEQASGQPAGGFPVPTGYSFAFADTTYPAPAGIQSYCNTNSWYEPCYGGDSMVVDVYVRPASTGWSVGTGGVSGLAPLADPGTDTARVSLTFRERAYWLFVTGHRQGDLRRLIRAYGRNEAAVYPIGTYFAPGAGQYGTDVTAPIAPTEYANPLFHGCKNRDA